MNKVIEFKNVTKKFNSTVLNGLSFGIEENSVVALIGNNGCGKTTTINIISNLIDIDSGYVEIFNKTLKKASNHYKKDFGFVLSQPYYIDEFNTLEYLKFACRFQFVPKSVQKQRIADIIDLLVLVDPHMAIRKLSSGNQMKVSLAAALIHNPRILVLDEPFVNLDIGTTQILITLLKSFNKKKTIFITSHNLDLVAELCDIFLIMQHGKISLELNKKDKCDKDFLKIEIKKALTESDHFKYLDWLK